jgi:hypothetical protein
MDVEVDPPQDICLSDLSLKAPNSESFWIQFFSDNDLSATKSCPFLRRLCTS